MIGDRLKTFRKAKGYSQEYMAIEMCLSQSQYSRLERKSENFTIEYLQRAAKILQIDVTQLLNANMLVTPPPEGSSNFELKSEAYFKSKTKAALIEELQELKSKEQEILRELYKNHNF